MRPFGREVPLNPIDRSIMDDFRRHHDDLELLDRIVGERLERLVEEGGIKTLVTQHRVKGEKSLAGKLVRHAGRYAELHDVTDLVGARVVCYFNDDIDRIGRLIEQSFDVDRERSTDKRELIDVRSFGYLSLHCICSLPAGGDYPERLCDWEFEIQVRTCLQHVWSDIEHDMGYKSEFGVPRVARRWFSRVSALLEVADDEFVRIRDTMEGYTSSVRERIIQGTADDVLLDTVSLGEFVRHNREMRSLIGDIAAIVDAEVEECEPAAYVAQLAWLGIDNLGGLQDMMRADREAALALARRVLGVTDLDIISSSAGLYYLCQAELCRRKLDVEQMADFLMVSLKNGDRARARAKRLHAAGEQLGL